MTQPTPSTSIASGVTSDNRDQTALSSTDSDDTSLPSGPIASPAKTDHPHFDVVHAIQHARHFLPAQGPISVFVHHNTLHAFDDMPFEEAVLEGGRRFGCEPYLSEERYHEELARGRICREDLREVLMADLQEDADKLVATFGTRYTLRLSMLQTELQPMPESGLNWALAETKLLDRFRNEVPAPYREKTITQTRSWVMRQLEPLANTQAAANSSTQPSPLPSSLRDRLQAAGESQIHRWNDQQWESFVLHALWEACQQGMEQAEVPPPTETHVDSLNHLMLGELGVDLNTKIDDVLIRFCGSFLDQGFADWALPEREDGFAKAFANLFLGRWAIRADWMVGIDAALREIQHTDWDAIQSIQHSLDQLGIPSNECESFLSECLLTLRGWAGMIWQMETNSPFLPNPVPEGSLNQYLAVRLILLTHAVEHFGKAKFSVGTASEIIGLAFKSARSRSTPSKRSRTHTVFQLAQLGGWTPEQLLNMSAAQWRCLITEIESFPSLDRRRLLHAAYERHYAKQALDAIAIHSRRRRELDQPTPPPAYAAIFCIDDREESFRRHLEEVDPECRTASAAGFFAVAMYYQGADHADFRPLCPGIISPQHYVREEPLFSSMAAGERRALRRRRLGWFAHQIHQNSRTLLGGWVTGLFGAVATVPMVARILAPRLTSQIRESMGNFVRPPKTELHLERLAAEPGSAPESMGYSLDEMSQIVVRILEDIGMVRDFPPIIVFFGHGSGSLNNPHESAYNCGACSGGRGGPNARAFAVMANDPRVRRRVAEQGIELPEEVRFVGAYHNTCSDDVDYYDLDSLPRSHRALFRRIESNVNETRARNAHERARRFESAPLDLTPQEALEHVEERAEDLSQARPEYNHATNALVTVGRRDWSRGLFLDRRAFVTEYDPAVDDEDCSVLTRILQAAIPVCSGISLEYYFSTVDVEGYGCGSKLPHNVASMVGVMTGAASDLRPGLSQQMIEIHEPMRILFVIETTAEKLTQLVAKNEGIRRLVEGNWVQVAVIDPATSIIQRYVDGHFEPHVVSTSEIPTVQSSMQWYRGQRDHLGFATIQETEIKQPMTSSESNASPAGVLA
ncbi:DUF2309 domain-containing protein [Rhodopirellula sp. P2]|uniref:DUF2309 domain-containing protein n=1 Tax=Rhodopirellula sp. P2 TaxID=2127060 RepID=UPI0023687F4D|nr:DUF2309 domain-containing protein [Rhodopirellula sp. P2]WDQ17535.1 DUF2309 domain-containing protein [Rhodopirellula sp. P2]